MPRDATSIPVTLTRWTATRTCPLCEATCGLELTMEVDRIVGVRGQADHVLSRGYLCPKGATFGDLEHDPDRLTSPRIRGADGWRDVIWDEALAHIAARLQPLIAEHGPDAVGVRVLHRQHARTVSESVRTSVLR